MKENYFIYFKSQVKDIPLPEEFTFPFNYEPHPLCEIAAKEVKEYLNTQSDWEHDFGLESKGGLGKMFGVLIAKNKNNHIGYLAAFSGILAGTNLLPHFVPPLFDRLEPEGFFKKGEAELDAINLKIEQLESDSEFLKAKEAFLNEKNIAEKILAEEKKKLKESKAKRKAKRKEGAALSTEDFEKMNEQLRQESLKQQYDFKDLKKEWKQKIQQKSDELDFYLNKINALKQERREKSNGLQQQLFEQYQFLNINKDKKNLYDIFKETPQKIPPAGAGECAAPKLLQYAFQYDLEPLAMAEFWWGRSPASEIRQHGNFYPACRGKCEPILTHMLSGMNVAPNPMAHLSFENKKLEIIYEDTNYIIINKPPDFLSVPGKQISDSVLTRMAKRYPEASGPLIVHRLDYSTSGLMVIALNEKTYKELQYQFIKRIVKKRYVALLNGILEQEEGTIDLPVRVDLDNRPRQLVCYEYGKSARTIWKRVDIENNKTRIHFFPVTGRTHQLRVHAAHPSGLNLSIIGDDLYGKKSDRLYLHAEELSFNDPETKTEKTFISKAIF